MEEYKNVKIQAASLYGKFGSPRGETGLQYIDPSYHGGVDLESVFERDSTSGVLTGLKAGFEFPPIVDIDRWSLYPIVIPNTEWIYHEKGNSRRERRLLRRASRRYNIRIVKIVINPYAVTIKYFSKSNPKLGARRGYYELAATESLKLSKLLAMAIQEREDLVNGMMYHGPKPYRTIY